MTIEAIINQLSGMVVIILFFIIIGIILFNGFILLKLITWRH